MGKENLFFSKSHFFKYIKERLFKSINLFAPSFSSLCSQLPSVPLNPSSCLGKLHGCLSFVKCFWLIMMTVSTEHMSACIVRGETEFIWKRQSTVHPDDPI